MLMTNQKLESSGAKLYFKKLYCQSWDDTVLMHFNPTKLVQTNKI